MNDEELRQAFCDRCTAKDASAGQLANDTTSKDAVLAAPAQDLYVVEVVLDSGERHTLKSSLQPLETFMNAVVADAQAAYDTCEATFESLFNPDLIK